MKKILTILLIAIAYNIGHSQELSRLILAYSRWQLLIVSLLCSRTYYLIAAVILSSKNMIKYLQNAISLNLEGRQLKKQIVFH